METMHKGARRPIGFKPWEISALINRPVVEQHAEESAFLWMQRDRAAVSPNYSLDDLAKLDRRVEAHLEGLRAAGPAGWEIASDARQAGPGESFAAAVLAFESEQNERIGLLLETAASDPALQRAAISALGWMPAAQALRVAARFRADASAEIRRLSLAAYAVHRQDPGDALLRAQAAAESRLRARALRAVGELGKTELAASLAAHFSAADPSCRAMAAWSAARLGMDVPAAIGVLTAVAEAGGPDTPRALDMAVRAMPPAEAKLWQARLARRPETLRLAVIAAGSLGDPEAVEWLIALMRDPALARVAGDAFSLISGADLGYEDLDADAPEGFGEQPGENTEDDNVAPDPDEDLEWPAPDRIAAWWSKRRSQFQPGVRYLRGEPVAPESLARTLVEGTQRQRAAAALELARRNPTQPLFEIRERGDRQLERLKRWTS